ncbi:hypothetical protein LY90DRAFT_666424 [Neocallimastix californiae]|uniref:Cyclophilin-like domain-containing protein n=1 Tax=Neocallimastix californiae TaxID=1754190 RepID=A0A1Y2EQW7_9FUNG|nr:hypothetical protein LY90DRAFT_666424 [Neocallimastix californiae]|eukprot:ORY73970.1 hypothetical protein LY90DRAFT_666424 [Neocallimastix californiae]
MVKLNLKKTIGIAIVAILIITGIILGVVLTTRNNDNNDNSLTPNKNYTLTDLNMKLVINDIEFQCTLENNDTAKVLLDKLPLTLKMNELHGNEKYYNFDDTFPTKSERISTIHEGDIMLYQNNCLVLFYDTFSSGYRYTRIGKINNIENLKKAVGSGDVTVKLLK